MRSIALTCVFLVTLGLAPTVAVAEDGEWGLAQLQAEIDALRAEIMKLKSDADRDPRDLLLEKYKNYTADDFKDKKREVEVRDILEWIFEDECPSGIRTNGAAAIKEAIWKDPDLDTTRKGSGQSNRAKVSKKIVSELDAKSRTSRAYASQLLKDLWGTPRDPAIRQYKPEERHKKTWAAAKKGWTTFLRKR